MSAAVTETTIVCPSWCQEHSRALPHDPNYQHNGARRTFTTLEGDARDIDMTSLLAPTGEPVDGWGATIWFDGGGGFSIETARDMAEFILTLVEAAEVKPPKV